MSAASSQITPTRSDAQDDPVLLRLRAEMRAAGLDALVALSQDNVTYTAGFLVPSHATNRFRRTITILAEPNFAAQIVVSVEYNQAVARSRFADIRSYDQFADDPAVILADVLREAGVAAGRIGIELDFLPAQDYLKLIKNLPQACFVPCADVYFKCRMIKAPAELDSLRKIGALTDRVIGDVVQSIRPGMTEIDVSRRLVDEMLAGGSGGFKYRIGSGANSGITNCGTTNKKIERGDIVRIEILGELDNYRSNCTRTAVVGTPTSEQSGIWAVLIRARDLCKRQIRPGLPVADLYRTYVAACREQGLEPTLQFLGHGIGQTIHEEPYITGSRDTLFQPNMVFTMEPLFMIPGRMGFHVEDMYVITESGFDSITGDISPNDCLIEVG